MFPKGHKAYHKGYWKGKKLSEDHKRKIRENTSKALKGKKKPDGFGEKLSKAIKGKPNFKNRGRKRPDLAKRNKENPLKMEKNPSWKGGISFEPYTLDWTETLRKAIRERDHYVCQICNRNGWIVHHIDYDKKNCNPDNLITLCRKCHLKTNNHRDYWINYFICQK